MTTRLISTESIITAIEVSRHRYGERQSLLLLINVGRIEHQAIRDREMRNSLTIGVAPIPLGSVGPVSNPCCTRLPQRTVKVPEARTVLWITKINWYVPCAK
jgi:hypothetical protein